ncbi:APC family permease [Ectobacillus ponti]|uniref:Amino acid permease n=1 Tax=Ectobacillus ponti TaxID=2961894 RepID=A0AA42BTE3_9BACI|nr:amino acid permease [Ectobacillus ponti]MCP8969388.1 amino acid permease [Ectobacillus ponti]
MKRKQIGPIALSGLMIGPILGSGIIILPPAVYEAAGEYAIAAWLIILGLSYLFARLFGQLTMQFPGDSGISLVVERAFGRSIKNLSALYFILAVCFGPVAVLGTAGSYLQLLLGQELIRPEWLTLALLLFTYAVLTREIAAVGKIAFIMSSLAVIILLIGSAATLLQAKPDLHLDTPFQAKAFGYSLLLLFWALIGWEVIGSYSSDIRDMKRTIPRAILLSFSVIAAVSIAVALAFQWSPHSDAQSYSLAVILQAAFGRLAVPFISGITIILCICTVLLVIGAVARLISDQAQSGALPVWLAARNQEHVPVRAFLLMFLLHTAVFVLLYLQVVAIHQLVAIANAFFLCNALLGTLASISVLPSRPMKAAGILLSLCFFAILLFSSYWMLMIVFALAGGFAYLQYKEHMRQACRHTDPPFN